MAVRARILIVDDEANALTALAELLRDEGFGVESSIDAEGALRALAAFRPDLLLTDLRMPGMDGIELMRRVRERAPDCLVVVMTAYEAIDSAVAALREGATDYLSKPIEIDALLGVIERALERRSARRAEQPRPHDWRGGRPRAAPLIGASPAAEAVTRAIGLAAPSRASVLIRGEVGTGKTLVAAAIHAQGPRAAAPFVTVSCAALSDAMLEGELFGLERAALAGGALRRDGRLLQADGGTVFLDDVGHVCPALQVRLLRLLQDHVVERPGGGPPAPADVRIVAATRDDLEALVREGRFREDLYYRLAVITIDVPPLRERPADIPLLAEHFLSRFARENAKPLTGFSDEAIARLLAHPWPGNVRELENAIERAVVASRGGHQVRAEELRPWVAARLHADGEPPPIPGSSLAEIERFAILRTMEHTRGSTSKAAQILGVSTRKIQYKLLEYRRPRPAPATEAGAPGAAAPTERDEGEP